MDYVNQAVSGMAKTWRNRDISKPLSQEQVEYFSNLAVQTPTKQSNRYFKIISITNIELIYELFHLTKPPHVAEDDHPLRNNSQVIAPLLICWMGHDPVDYKYPGKIDKKYFDYADREEIESDIHQAIGISAGTVAYEANRLGFVTGFCKCFVWKPLNELFSKYGCDLGEFDVDYRLDLTLSIGYPKFEDRHQHQFLTSHKYYENKKPEQIIHYIK